MPKARLSTKKKRPPGPAPDELKIEADWRDMIKKALEKKRPPGGFPVPPKRYKSGK